MTNVKNTFSQPGADGDNALNLNGTINIDGTELTPSAAELNKLDDMAATKNDLAETAEVVSNATLVKGAAGATQTITIQAKDADGNNATGTHVFRVYMCTDAAGGAPSTTGCNTSVTATTGAILKANTAKLDLDIITDATGKAVLVFNNTGGGATYTDKLALVLPHSGKVVISEALAVATA